MCVGQTLGACSRADLRSFSCFRVAVGGRHVWFIGVYLRLKSALMRHRIPYQHRGEPDHHDARRDRDCIHPGPVLELAH